MKIIKIIVDEKPIIPNCMFYGLCFGRCKLDNKKCWDKCFNNKCPLEVEKKSGGV